MLVRSLAHVSARSRFAPPPRLLAAAFSILLALVALPAAAYGQCDLLIDDDFAVPGASCAGWSYPSEGELVLNGYDGGPITCYGDLTLTIEGTNAVAESARHGSGASSIGLEVWGNLQVNGAGSLAVAGAQYGLYAAGEVAATGGSLTCRASGSGVSDGVVAGVRARGLRVEGGAIVDAAAGSNAGASSVMAVGAFIDEPGSPAPALIVNASTLHGSGSAAGVLANGVELIGAGITLPSGGVVVDLQDHPSGLRNSVAASFADVPATDVCIEPAKPAAGETPQPDPAAATTEPATDPAPTPTAPDISDTTAATTAPSTKSTVTKTKAASKQKTTHPNASLPKTGDNTTPLLSAALLLSFLLFLTGLTTLKMGTYFHIHF